MAALTAALAKWEGVTLCTLLRGPFLNRSFSLLQSHQLSQANGALLVSLTAPSFCGTFPGFPNRSI